LVSKKRSNQSLEFAIAKMPILQYISDTYRLCRLSGFRPDCWRRAKIDQPYRLKFDQGAEPVFGVTGCG